MALSYGLMMVSLWWLSVMLCVFLFVMIVQGSWTLHKRAPAPPNSCKVCSAAVWYICWSTDFDPGIFWTFPVLIGTEHNLKRFWKWCQGIASPQNGWVPAPNLINFGSGGYPAYHDEWINPYSSHTLPMCQGPCTHSRDFRKCVTWTRRAGRSDPAGETWSCVARCPFNKPPGWWFWTFCLFSPMN